MNFNKLKEYSDKFGEGYGTEDFSIFLYSLIKMTKPNIFVEFGTGTGSCLLWAATACKENNLGKAISIDNGSSWNQISKENIFDKKYIDNYSLFINDMVKEHELNNFAIFKNENFNLKTFNDINCLADIVFFDFNHGPDAVINILRNMLSNISANSIIFIDSIPTSFESNEMLKKILNGFNNNLILEDIKLNKQEVDFVFKSRFDIINIIEKKNRNQNSVAMIKVSPKRTISNEYF